VAIQTNRPSNRIFIVIGVILAAAAAVGVFLLAKGGTSSGNSVNVVVANTTIPAGTPVTASELSTTSADQSVVPADAFQDVNAVVGKQFVNTVSANTIIARSLVVTSNSVVSSTADTLPAITPGFVAMAIPAAPTTQPFSTGGPFQTAEMSGDQVAVGYYIASGDHIDILVDNGNGIHYSFQDVRVMKAGAPTAVLGSAVTFYVVELPRVQAEQMTFMLTHGLIASKADQTQPQTAQGGWPQIAKYVLRPTKEYGSPTSTDPTKAYPHYEDSCPTAPKPLPYPGFNCNALPTVQDPTVNQGTLTGLFGH
jgi:Flp pilus assembly protein CpaB